MNQSIKSSLLLAFAMSSTLSTCAFAATINISTDTDITATQTLGNGDILNISQGVTLSSSTVEVVKTSTTASHTFTVNNEGSIIQNSTSLGAKRVINAETKYTTSGGQVINNGSVVGSSALIQAFNEDAMRIGSNVTVNNYGTIESIGVVNTKDSDLDGTQSDIGAYDGLAMKSKAKNSTINNYGTIIGARHGIDISEKTSVSASEQHTVTNYASGTIIGRNGSGVGSDGDGVVVNHGLISGRYAGAGNVFAGNDPTSLNGDGDGVDIDGVATITNYGRIEALGAGGVDSDGNPNGADGIAAGGGTIVNHAGATIYGQSKGILIDDGANGTTVARRGTDEANGAEVSITNSGTITAEKKTAIGLVGDFADTITNDSGGVITGGKDSVRVDEALSTTQAAAIQMGGGADTLTNNGAIVGLNGMAIDMGDGDDTLNLLGGSVTGSISGGAGVNTLVLGGAQSYKKSQISGFTNLTTQSGAIVEAEVKQSTTPLEFSGSVNLADGTIIKPIVKGKVADGSTHSIIQAASLTVDASQLVVEDGSALLDFTLSKSGNDLVVTATKTGELKSVVGGEHSKLATALEGATGENIDKIHSALNSFGSAEDVKKAVAQLSLDRAGGARAASASAQSAVFGALAGRMGSAGGSSGLSSGENDDSRGWIEFLASNANQDSIDGADGYFLQATGLAAGYESDLSVGETLGFTAGYTGAQSSGRDASSGDVTDIDSVHLGVYYTLERSGFSFDSALLASYNHYSSKRVVDVLGLSETLNGNYDGYGVGAMVEVGMPISKDAWNIKPLAGFLYSFNQTESYDENGGSAALSVDSVDASSFKSVVGGEFTHSLGSGKSYELGLRYLHEFVSAPTTTAGFIGSGSTFSIDGATPPRDALRIGAGYKFLSNNGSTLSARYDVEVKEQYLSHQISLKMSF